MSKSVLPAPALSMAIRSKVSEIEELHVRHIAEAKHFIYAENQYFTSRVIGEAIAKRLEEPDPPEIIVVHPKSADGWMETQAMDPARDALVEAIRKLDTKNRFHIYVPIHWRDADLCARQADDRG